jgi:hypothetical protein
MAASLPKSRQPRPVLEFVLVMAALALVFVATYAAYYYAQ